MVEGVKYGLEVFPIISRLEGLEEHRKLPSGPKPQMQTIKDCWTFYTHFMPFYALLSDYKW